MDEENKNYISEEVLVKIRNKEIAMKSRGYFLLHTILFLLVTLTVFLCAVYLLSFIIFYFRMPDRSNLVFSILPWILILASMILVFILEFFAEQVSFIYRQPAIYSLFAILVIVLMVSFLLSITPLHGSLLKRNRQKPIPFIGRMYRVSMPAPRLVK